MRKFPEPIQTLMTEFGRLPGVGPKTALRYVYRVLSLTKEQRKYFAQAIVHLDDVKICSQCFMHSELPTCTICQHPSRDRSLLCIVAESRDISTIEATDHYTGLYHVLGGVLNPPEGITREQIRVQELVTRLETDPSINEIILALSPDVYGDMTMTYLANLLRPLNRKVTKLARGLPLGAELEFADEITLGDALEGRREMS